MPSRPRAVRSAAPARGNRRKNRFFRWYRALPIIVMLLVTALSVSTMFIPRVLLRQMLYPVNYSQEILDSSARHGVDPILVCAVIKCESNWNASAQSSAGAVGLMQMLETTSEELALAGVVDETRYDSHNLTDPATSIEYGCAYLGLLETMLNTNDEVIAAYNAGPGTVEQWLMGSDDDISEVIDYPETASYLARVNRMYEHYQSFYDQSLNER